MDNAVLTGYQKVGIFLSITSSALLIVDVIISGKTTTEFSYFVSGYFLVSFISMLMLAYYDTKQKE